MPKNLIRLIVLPLILFISLSFSAQAQAPGNRGADVDWREVKTDYFVIVYAESIEGPARFTCACGLDEAQPYVEFVDKIYLIWYWSSALSWRPP